MATSAAALGRKVIIFFASDSLFFIMNEKKRNWKYLKNESLSPLVQNKVNIQSGLVSFEELIESSIELNINFFYCSMLEKTLKPKFFLKNIEVKKSSLAFIFAKENNISQTLFI
tara:strand:+ start:180 stop:521 length:342 start_codon:yes stop_codon:yes gene_type:complete